MTARLIILRLTITAILILMSWMLSEPSAFTLIAQLTGFFCIRMFCPNITLQPMLIIFGMFSGELKAEPVPADTHANDVRIGVMHGFVITR